MIPNYIITMSIIPIFLTLKSIYTLFQSKGKCVVFHNYQEVPEKYRGDPRNQRLRVAGVIKWKCVKCEHDYHEKWSAF